MPYIVSALLAVMGTWTAVTAVYGENLFLLTAGLSTLFISGVIFGKYPLK